MNLRVSHVNNTLIPHPRISPVSTLRSDLGKVRATLCGRLLLLIRINNLAVNTETIASLQAFRKRHADAQRIHSQLSAQPTNVDLSHYRSVLKNKTIIDEAEKILKEFQPVSYDVSSHVKAIETFETKAVRGG